MLYVKNCLTMCLIFLLLGCYEKPMPENVIAFVNDRPITLQTIRSLQDIDLITFNENGKPTLAKLRKQYGKTLSKVILYEMILQSIESHNYSVSTQQVEAYEKSLRSSYPPEEFEKFITDNAIDVDAWRILLRYQLAMNIFKAQVLLKYYVPTADEVKQYYNDNKANFSLQQTYTLQVGLSYDKAQLVNIIDLDSLKQKSEIEQYEINIGKQSIQKSWLNAITKLKDGKCTDILEQDQTFSRMCLIKKNESRNLSITEAYVYIERQLGEEHVGKLFNEWIDENIKNFDIKVSKHLIKEMM